MNPGYDPYLDGPAAMMMGDPYMDPYYDPYMDTTMYYDPYMDPYYDIILRSLL